MLAVVMKHPQGEAIMQAEYSWHSSNVLERANESVPLPDRSDLEVEALLQIGRSYLVGETSITSQAHMPSTFRGRVSAIFSGRTSKARVNDWEMILTEWKKILEEKTNKLNPNLKYTPFNKGLENYSGQSKYLAKKLYEKDLADLTMVEAIEVLTAIHDSASRSKSKSRSKATKSEINQTGQELILKFRHFCYRPIQKAVDDLIDILNSGAFEKAVILQVREDRFTELCKKTIHNMMLPQLEQDKLLTELPDWTAEKAVFFLYENLGLGIRWPTLSIEIDKEFLKTVKEWICNTGRGVYASMQEDMAIKLLKIWSDLKDDPIIPGTRSIQVSINGAPSTTSFQSFISKQLPATIRKKVCEFGYANGYFSQCEGIDCDAMIYDMWDGTRRKGTARSRRFIMATLMSYEGYAIFNTAETSYRSQNQVVIDTQTRPILKLILRHPQGRDIITRHFKDIPLDENVLIGGDELITIGGRLFGGAIKTVRHAGVKVEKNTVGRVDRAINSVNTFCFKHDFSLIFKGWENALLQSDYLLDPTLPYAKFNDALEIYSNQAEAQAKKLHDKELKELTIREAMDVFNSIYRPATIGYKAEGTVAITRKNISLLNEEVKHQKRIKCKQINQLISSIEKGEVESSTFLDLPESSTNALCITVINNMLLPRKAREDHLKRIESNTAADSILFLYDSLEFETREQTSHPAHVLSETKRLIVYITAIRRQAIKTIDNRILSDMMRIWGRLADNPFIPAAQPIQVTVSDSGVIIPGLNYFLKQNTYAIRGGMSRRNISVTQYEAGTFSECENIDSPGKVCKRWKSTCLNGSRQTKKFVLATIAAYCNAAEIYGCQINYKPAANNGRPPIL